MRFFAAADSDDPAQYVLDFFNSTADILCYANAIVAAVLPIIPDPPDWYVAFCGPWSAVKTHAEGWLFTLQPLMASIIDALVTFNDDVTSEMNLSQVDIALLIADPNDSKAKNNLLLSLGRILQLLSGPPKEIDDFLDQLVHFRTQLTADLAALQNAVTDANGSVGADKAKIGQLLSDIANLRSAIDSYNQTLTKLDQARKAGIFIAAVGLGIALVSGGAGAGVIAAGVVLIGGSLLGDILIDKAIADANAAIAVDTISIGDTNTQIGVLNDLVSQLNALSNLNAAAQSAAATLKTVWDTLSADVAAFISSIQSVEGDTDYTKAQADLTAAINEWSALQAFITPLSTIDVNVSTTTTFLPKAA